MKFTNFSYLLRIVHEPLFISSWVVFMNLWTWTVLGVFSWTVHEQLKNNWRICWVLKRCMNWLQYWFKNSWRICLVLKRCMNWFQYWLKNSWRKIIFLKHPWNQPFERFKKNWRKCTIVINCKTFMKSQPYIYIIIPLIT